MKNRALFIVVSTTLIWKYWKIDFALWDKAEEAAVFESGMSAITTVLLEFLKPGDLLLYSNPVYGGSDHFINHYLPSVGVEVIGFRSEDNRIDIIKKIESTGKADRLKMIYTETPANPTNSLYDLEMISGIAQCYSNANQKVITAVDNTYLGPLWQHPLKHGIDLVLYSATKYIGGHSDLIAGAVLGNSDLITRIKTLRTFLGNMASPWTGWLLLRSLETLKVRMEQQCVNAQMLAEYLDQHPKVEKVYYLGLISPNSKDYSVYRNQCKAPGAMISFDLKGGEKEAFQFLNNLKLAKLAVSLGSTETLVQHPATMTHAGVDPQSKLDFGITEKMVRLSVGVENVQDLIYDIENALKLVSRKTENVLVESLEV